MMGLETEMIARWCAACAVAGHADAVNVVKMPTQEWTGPRQHSMEDVLRHVAASIRATLANSSQVRERNFTASKRAQVASAEDADACANGS